MDRKDPYRAANLLIRRMGSGAATHAVSRCAELKLAGDKAGVRVWTEIAAAILQLQATEPARGQAVH